VHKKLGGLLVAILMISAACGSSPSVDYTLGDNVRSEQFDRVEVWDTFAYGDDVFFRIENGGYRATASDVGGYIWALDINGLPHTDVVIEIETTQLSDLANNGYGVMCRADINNNGDGYYFLISGDRYYAIARGNGDDIVSLVEGTIPTDAFRRKPTPNTIRAVCIGNYLALYINEFLTETHDSLYTWGLVGLAVTAFEAGDVDIKFDNLNVWEATLNE
jgi:hypothetical protein